MERGLPKATIKPLDLHCSVAWWSTLLSMAEQAWGKSLLAALETEVRAHPGEQGCQAAGFPSPCDRPALIAGVSGGGGSSTEGFSVIQGMGSQLVGDTLKRDSKSANAQMSTFAISIFHGEKKGE